MNKNQKYYHINNSIINDLWAIDVGHTEAKRNETIVNRYPYFLIHYVTKGKGYVEFDGRKTDIDANKFFVLFPDTDVKYYADKKEPWNYYWINFNGLKALSLLSKIGVTKENFYSLKPIKELEQYFSDSFAARDLKNATAFEVEACLFKIFSIIIESQDKLPTTKEDAKSTFQLIFAYIQDNLFSPNLTAQKIAEKFGLNTNYFSTLFKSNCNITFKEYVNYERIKKASDILLTTNEPIKNVALAIGFTDALYFSKVFTKYRLMNPTDFRNKNKTH